MENLPKILFVLVTIASFSNAPEGQLELFKQCIERNGYFSADLIVTRNSANSTLYKKLDYRWTTRPPHIYPLGYFVPSSTQQVQIGVKCARQINLPIVPKSGGHSAELFSFGSAQTLVISLQHLNQIKVNATEATATIGSGALLGDIRQELWNNGHFGISAGLCADVGIGGQVLGGGKGYVTPLYGLTLDAVVEMEMVDSDGNVHIANKDQNEDLFWVLRGVGSGFIGIVTYIKFKLFKASNIKSSVVHLTYDLSHATSVLNAYQNWLKFTIVQSHNVSSIMRMGYHNRDTYVGVLVIIVLVEDVSKGQGQGQGQDFFDLVKSSFPPTENATIGFPPYIELWNYNKHARVPLYVKMSSIYVDKIFNSTQLEQIGQLVANIGDRMVKIYFEGYGGVMNKIPANATAFVHRNALYTLNARVYGESEFMTEEQIQRATAWYNEFKIKSKFMDNGESYQNYVDTDMGVDFMKRYYGTNAPRLIAIKTKWDPFNYFKNTQSIPVIY